MARPRVLVSRLIPAPALELLQGRCDVDLNRPDKPLAKKALLSRLKGKQGLLCLLTDAIDADVLSAPGLRAVSNVAVGFNNIDVPAATSRGVLVTNTPGVLTDTTADFAWCLLMAAARRVGEGERMIRRGKFRGWGVMMLLGQEVHGKTIGIVGFGRIGQAMARRARGFGMRILYAEEAPVDAELERDLLARRVPLDELLRESDFVSLHVPLLKETHHLIGEAEFARMKPTAVLVNTARGPVIDEKALVKALKTRRIAAAGLDVYEDEPKLAAGLTKLENAVLAPHIASATVETRTRMAMMAAEDMIAALEGRRPSRLVNPEAFKG